MHERRHAGHFGPEIFLATLPTLPTMVSVQNVVVDSAGLKLLCVDRARDGVVDTIALDRDVALPTTYRNDVRFDLERNAAFITDSGTEPSHPTLTRVAIDAGPVR